LESKSKSRLARIGVYRFIKPLGVTTYLLLLFSLIYGIFGLNLTHHRIIAVLTLIIASTHGLIVGLVYRKRRISWKEKV